MKRILILLLGLFSVAQAQFAPTSAKTAFKWGVSIGTRDSTAYAANDSLVVVINRQGRMMYRSTDGYWKLLANAASSDFVPYTGAVTNVNLGNYRLTARSIKTDSIYANSSAGMYLTTNSGSVVAHWGSGGSVEVDFKGFAGYDANRASSYTARSFTDKNYVDSSAALRVRYTDTAAMLAPFIQYSDTTGLFGNVVRTFGNQTVNGIKTFGSDLVVNGLKIGRGNGSNSSNAVFGSGVFNANTTGTRNVAIGESALSSNTTGYDNTAIGWYSVDANNTGYGNTGIGAGALGNNSTGFYNIGIGVGAGEYITGLNPNSTGNTSIFLGYNSKAAANGETNQIVIGHNLTGNGSNTVTIGNSSVTNNYFSGNVRAGAFIKSGGTSSQFLKADGSVDGTAYGTGSVTSVSAGTGMSFTTITSSGAVNADTTTLATRAYVVGLDVGKANTSLNNVNGVLSSTYGGAGSVSGILKANGSGVVSAAVAGTDYVAPSALSGYLPLSGGTLTGPLNGTSAAFSGRVSSGGSIATSPYSFTANGDLTSVASGIVFKTNTTEAFYLGQSSIVDATNWEVYNTQNGYLRFATNNLERLRISSGGNTLIKTTTDNGTDALQVAGSGLFTDNGSGPFGAQLKLKNNTSSPTLIELGNSANGHAFGFSSTGTQRFVFINGSVAEIASISSTGAATFASSVTSNGFIVNNSSAASIALNNTTSGVQWTTSSNNSGLYVINNGIGSGISIGASSNISAGSMILTSNMAAKGYVFNYAAKSSNYTLTSNDDYINVTSSCTITLPTASGLQGKRYVIKCTGSAVATIATTSSQTIDGNAASSYTFGGPNFNIMIVYSDGSNWFLEAWATGI